MTAATFVQGLIMSYCMRLLLCIAAILGHGKLVLVGGGLYNHTVYINPITGIDTESCITSINSPSVHCKSLNWAFLPKHRHNSTQYVLLNGLHQINDSVDTFENLHTIAFAGKTVNTTIYCTDSERETGLAFKDVSQVVFTNITFLGCSSERYSTSRNFSVPNQFAFSTMQVSLYFYHCRDVNMSYINVDRPGSGATGVVMYDTDGTNTISHCSFTNCIVEPKHPGGGGFYVEFSYCVPGNVSCSKNSDHIISHESRNAGAQFHFLECTFSHNRANDSATAAESDTNFAFIVANRVNHEAFGRGGGLSIFIKGNATANAFNVTKCSFDSNEAVWGGGLFVEFQDDTADNHVTVNQSTFTNNECHFTTRSGTGGGGMRIGHFEKSVDIYHDHDLLQIANDVTLSQCNFTNNIALNGGGLSVHSTIKERLVVDVATVFVSDSNFSDNVARLGAAIYVNPFSIYNAGNTLSVYIKRCEFTGNSIDYVQRIKWFQGQPYQIGAGSVYINNINVYFQEKVNFSENTGSALAVVGAVVNFTSCEANFMNNTGNNGGAIALLGAAYIQVGENTTMNFYENKAVLEGGAIYNRFVQKENLKTDLNCFVQYENPLLSPNEWKAHFSFYGNNDQDGHRLNDIHSTSLLPCSNNTATGISGTLIFCNKLQWNFTTGCTCSLTSDVGNIEYVGTGNLRVVEAYPGKPFQLPIKVQDDVQNPVSLDQTIFSVSVNDNASESMVDHLPNFKYFWGETATLKQAPNQLIPLKLHSLGDRVWRVDIIVDMQSCPPGFKPTNSNTGNLNQVCNCSQDYHGALLCDYSLFSSYLKNGHWMGKMPNESEYLVGQCPPGYCTYSNISMHLQLPNTAEKLEQNICGQKNRRGILCGLCLEGFGIAVNSLSYGSACAHCNGTQLDIKSNIAKYIASIYTPLFFLFTIIIFFDIRLTTGPANAFILYCQVVASTFSLNADGQIPLEHITKSYNKLLGAYRVPYGIFNLEFVENFLPPLCFGTHLNALSVFALDYIVALFPLLMIIFVLLCVKLHSWLSCLRRDNDYCECSTPRLPPLHVIANRKRSISEAILPAFAAFLLLSYTKFSIVSSYLIKHQPLIDENGSHVSTRFYYAGEVEYSLSNLNFLKYFVPATIVFATFVFIPPLVLLDYPLRAFEWCISKVACLWRFYPVDKVHVFLDTFQGCYKNKMRFFAGLYFLFRLIVNVSYIFTTWLEQYMVQQLACTIMVVLLALFQPYKNKLFNYVDILIFANLAVLNVLSFYMYSFSLYNPQFQPPTTVFAIQYILVFLPLIYMLIYIAMSVAIVCRQRKVGTSFEVAGWTSNNTEVESKHEDDEIEAILERAEEKNSYRPLIDSPQSASSVTKQNTADSKQSSLRYGSTDNTQVSKTN